MNIARCCLLLMLAMLLALRGVVAAAMPCAPTPAGHGPAQAQHVHAQAQAHSHGAAHPTHHGAQDGKSSLCAASCAASLLPAQATAPLPASSLTRGLRFPALVAPVPTFLSDGLERPPRRI